MELQNYSFCKDEYELPVIELQNYSYEFYYATNAFVIRPE